MIQLNTTSLFGNQDSSNSLLPSSSESQDGNSFEKALTASLASNLGKFGVATNNVTLPSAPAAPETAAATPVSAAATSVSAVSPFAAAATSVTPCDFAAHRTGSPGAADFQ